jgi:outer membrane immunogenic protein
MRSSGFTGGLQAGANYQLGSLVVGLEADINSFRLRNSFGFGPVRPAPAFPITVTGSGSVNTDWLATFRPRVGFAIDRFLVFATGGLAITNQNDSFNDLFVTGPGGPFTGTVGNFNVTSSRSVGWTAGAGVEYAFAPRWSLKAEYLHLDFGSVTATVGVTNLPPPAFCPCGLTAASLNVRSHLTTDVGRVGLNYRLN